MIAQSGTYVTESTAGETYQAFVPNALPPSPDVLVLEFADMELLEEANRALGRLDGVPDLFPDLDTNLFNFLFVRKEALLSSQIEGTQSSFSDLLLFEEELVPASDDVLEVSNYVVALDHGIRRIREDDFPLSNRLIKEMHALLLRSGRGSDKLPGQFRRTPVWLGGSRPSRAVFVPPPWTMVDDKMSELEAFLHDRDAQIPTLVKAALIHAQFETIHPFLDGNGRLGRLLITLYLCAHRVLAEPLLYLSLFFKENRSEYYTRLQGIRRDDDWIGWTRFFLRGVVEVAAEASLSAKRIRRVFEEDREKIEAAGRAGMTMARVHDLLKRRAVIDVIGAATLLELTPPTVRSALDAMTQMGLVREMTGRKKDKRYTYDRLLHILEEGTEPLPR
ncbi:MAG: Fic family protein [Deltaproteobacteria bacterium]|nr:Fic family protein [Deltaproteobacteria bacterium]